MVPPQLGEVERDLSRVAEGLASAFDELREISRGIHPLDLVRGGPGAGAEIAAPAFGGTGRARPARRASAARASRGRGVLRGVRSVDERRQARAASVVKVELDAHDAILQLAIRDDGLGGADPSRGSGLVGLSDRIKALGSTLEVTSPTGSGTTLLIELPVKG